MDVDDEYPEVEGEGVPFPQANNATRDLMTTYAQQHQFDYYI